MIYDYNIYVCILFAYEFCFICMIITHPSITILNVAHPRTTYNMDSQFDLIDFLI